MFEIKMFSLTLRVSTNGLFTSLISLFVVIMNFACSCENASAADVIEPGYKILLRAEIAGRQKITFSKSGMKAEHLNAGYSVITKAPDWKVTIANARTKKYIVLPRDKFKGGVSSQLYQHDKEELQNGKWVKVSTEKIRSRIIAKFSMVPKPIAPNARKRTNIIKQANISIYQDVPVPPEIHDVLEKIFFLPRLPGMPYWFDYTTDEELTKHCHAIDTDAFTESKINLKEYDLPKGLSLAKTEKEVFVDPVSKEVFDGFTDGTNLGGMGELKH